MHYQPCVKAGRHSGDELPKGYQSGEKGGENHEILTASLGTKAEVKGIQSETI